MYELNQNENSKKFLDEFEPNSEEVRLIIY